MSLVAKKKDPAPHGRPQKHEGKPDRQGRSGVPLSIRLDPELRALVPTFQAEFRKRHDVRLSLTDVVEKGLRAIYREYGILPPDAAPTA